MTFLLQGGEIVKQQPESLRKLLSLMKRDLCLCLWLLPVLFLPRKMSQTHMSSGDDIIGCDGLIAVSVACRLGAKPLSNSLLAP